MKYYKQHMRIDIYVNDNNAEAVSSADKEFPSSIKAWSEDSVKSIIEDWKNGKI